MNVYTIVATDSNGSYSIGCFGSVDKVVEKVTSYFGTHMKVNNGPYKDDSLFLVYSGLDTVVNVFINKLII